MDLSFASRGSALHAAGTATTPLLGAAGVVLAVLAALAAGDVETERFGSYVAMFLVHGCLYAVCVVLVMRRQAGSRDLALILAVAVVLRGLAMTAPENLSTDVYRYIWDGNLQLAGVSPYAYVPADPALERFRDYDNYEDINQKDTAHTIYPPVAQMAFLAAAWLGDEIESVKLVMVGFEALTIWALLAWLRTAGLPRERVLIYAWHPLPIWELASQAHVDAALATFVMLAILAATRGRQGLAGMALAAAALVKYFPLVLAPALWRRWGWRMPLTLATTAILLYLPYMASSGRQLVGHLPNHLAAEGYADGQGFHLVWLLRALGLPSPSGIWYVVAAISVLAGLALVIMFRARPDSVEPSHLLLLAAGLLFLASPHYPWYFAWLVPLLVLSPHPAVLAMSILAATLHLDMPEAGGWSRTATFLFTYWLPALLALLLAARRWIPRNFGTSAGQPCQRMIT